MTSSSRPPPVVLIVDDDPDTRAMLALWFRQSGCRVVEAATCVGALDRVFECQPDVIVTDMALPGVDGEELCRRIRQNPVTRAIPIIAATGWAMPAEVERARQAGCDHVFVKPCSITDLLDAVLSVVPALPPLHALSSLGA
jgi:CheY-like chemotaxis protein